MIAVQDNAVIETELAERGSYASVTKGISMRPLFRTNRDMIVVAPLKSPPKKYDIVLYRGMGGEYILHRIIKVKEDVYVIRGDNTYFKEYVPKERVFAILVSYNRKGKSGSPSSFSFKLYSRVWNLLYPLRFLYVKLRSLAHRIYRKLFKRNK